MLCHFFLSLPSRSLRIPSHISILYVEQEVTGDDTTALESVLECDIQRKTLLNREKEIQSRISQGWVTTASLNLCVSLCFPLNVLVSCHQCSILFPLFQYFTFLVICILQLALHDLTSHYAKETYPVKLCGYQIIKQMFKKTFPYLSQSQRAR